MEGENVITTIGNIKSDVGNEDERITIATANARRGWMIRSKDGLTPFKDVDFYSLMR